MARPWVILILMPLVAGCLENVPLDLPPPPPPGEWAELGTDPATAYDCLLHSARAFSADPDMEVRNSTGTWRVAVGDEDRIRLQLAALRADPFDRVRIQWEGRSFRALFGSAEHAGALPEVSKLPDGRTVYQGTVEVIIQAAMRGSRTIEGSLVPRGGGGALACETAIVEIA